LWRQTPLQFDPPEDSPRTDHAAALYPFRPHDAIPPAQWYINLPVTADQTVEADPARVNQQTLFRYRNIAVEATPGQPWYLWPTAKADQTVEADAVRANHTNRLFFGRAQTAAGQPWHYWPTAKADQTIEASSAKTDPQALFAYRAITITAPPFTPLWMWPAAIADQWIEPNPVVTDHAATLYPFRPHDALTPPVVVPPVNPGGGLGWGHGKKPPKHLREVVSELVDEVIADRTAPLPATELPSVLAPSKTQVIIPVIIPRIDVYQLPEAPPELIPLPELIDRTEELELQEILSFLQSEDTINLPGVAKTLSEVQEALATLARLMRGES